MNKDKIKTQKKYYGFTLVELIIVITILAILATIAFVSFNSYVKDSRDSKRLADINQIKKGVEIYKESFSKTPIPDQAKYFTGGKNTLYVGKINNKVLSNLSKDTFDPLSKQEYIYATFGTGEYFQIGTFSENDLSYNIIDKTYADYKTAIVEGNYLFDPSLPSLLISSGTTLYNPNNCFIINGFNNGLENNNNCLPKNKMSLDNYDKSLVGYWDMETTSGINIIKDLSGNGNDLTLSGITYSQNLTGGLIGKSIKFNGIGIAESIKELKYNNSFNSTISVIVSSEDSTNNINYMTGGQIILESSNNFNYNTGSYLISDFDKSNSYFNEYRVNGGVKFDVYPEHKYYLTRSSEKSKPGYKIITMVNSNGKKGKEVFLYINGVKQNNDSEDPIDKYKNYNNLKNDILLNYKLYVGNRKDYKQYKNKLGFLGNIDDIKIYNRVLSDNEILQQAKILGL